MKTKKSKVTDHLSSKFVEKKRTNYSLSCKKKTQSKEKVKVLNGNVYIGKLYQQIMR